MSRKRVVIENLKPDVNDGQFPIKRVVGEVVVVAADVLADGHDLLQAQLLFRHADHPRWTESRMEHVGNDRWRGSFTVDVQGVYLYTVQAWIDHFGTFRHDLRKKWEAEQDVQTDLFMATPYLKRMYEVSSRSPAVIGDDHILQEWLAVLSQDKVDQAEAVTLLLSEQVSGMVSRYPLRDNHTVYKRELQVRVDRKKALFGTWYELFPRSVSEPGAEPGAWGSFRHLEKLLPDVRDLGFDILYLPPIHPVGKTKRKGKNNAVVARADEPGSPWAIGSEDGGHTSIDPALGTLKDFENLVEKAMQLDIEIALDIAFQCSPDHPWVKEHPQWFRWRPDGTVQFAENPPKRYEDILPLNFECDDWRNLWKELREVFLFWIGKGVKIFRIDNPHTKPFPFWEWVIGEVKKEYPDALFLAEAFTRPKVMYRLAKLGFTQSYTYFTWRNTKRELESYLREITRGEPVEFFRPNFWPNTPDILPEFLQYGGRPAFIIRLILAATLSSSYGVYGPAFELCVNTGLSGREEYAWSEKYEIKHWDREAPGNIRDVMRTVNRLRRENPALQSTRNIRFYETDDENLICYERATDDFSNVLFVVVNLDPFHTHAGRATLPLTRLGLPPERSFYVHDLFTGERHLESGELLYVDLDPSTMPFRIFRLERYVRRENDYDYYL